MTVTKSLRQALTVLLLLLGTATKGTLQTVYVEGGNIIPATYYLLTGSFLTQGSFSLIMQDDCNLVLYENEGGVKRPIWSTNTYGKGNFCYLKLESEGRLVVYDGLFHELRQCRWASESLADPNRGSIYFRRRDGVGAILYDDAPTESSIIWTTTTGSGTTTCIQK